MESGLRSGYSMTNGYPHQLNVNIKYSLSPEFCVSLYASPITVHHVHDLFPI